MYPYIHNNFRNKYIDNLNEFIKDKDKRFKKLMKYFIKKLEIKVLIFIKIVRIIILGERIIFVSHF